ncbi:MAG: hypothetical protein AAF802_29100 [Planctomycetota bacterium]
MLCHNTTVGDPKHIAVPTGCIASIQVWVARRYVIDVTDDETQLPIRVDANDRFAEVRKRADR